MDNATVSFKIDELQKIGTEMLKTVAAICEEEHFNYTMFFGSMLAAVRHHGPIPWDYDIDIAIHENDFDRFIAVMEQKLPAKYWVDYRSKYDTAKCMARIGLRGFDTRSLHIDIYRMVGFPDSMKESLRFVKKSRLFLEMRLVKNERLDYYSGEKLKKIKRLRKLLWPVSTKFIVGRYDALCKKYPYETANKVGLNSCKRKTDYIYDKAVIEDTILVDYADFKVRIPREYDKILTGIYKDYMKYPAQEKIDAAMNKDYLLHKLDMDEGNAVR